MQNAFLATLWANYHIGLSVLAFIGIALVNIVAARLVLLVPGFRAAYDLNEATAEERMKKPSYAANMKMNRRWGLVFSAVIFGLFVPFTLTLDSQPLWKMLLDIFVILMVYDFFYYFTHRFLFHDTGSFQGPLKWVHAVHHRQHNPCRMDSGFLNPIETAIGLGLYVGTIVLLSLVMGRFHIATIIATWVAFQQINLHNHDLWKGAIFPGKYLATMSEMHHHHHARFTGGNFATITLFYDWLFGTIDHGAGPGVPVPARNKALG